MVLLLALLLAIAVPLHASTSIVPGVANAPGANGTVFQSDLAITNPTAASATATLHFIGYPVPDRNYTIQPGQSLLLPNVVRAAWNLENIGGAVRVTSDARLVVAGKTYNNSPSGTYGNALPVLDAALLLSAGEEGISPWISQSAGFRTNIGVVFPDAEGGAASLTVYDAAGRVTGRRELDFPTAAFSQFPSALLGSTGEGHLSIQVTRGTASGYTSVIDNVTGDSSVFRTERVFYGPSDLILGGMGRTAGANGTYWRSDVRLFNPGDTALVVTVRQLQPDVDNSGAARVTLSLGAGETREIPDVLAALFNARDGATGALRFSAPGPLVVAGRTSNVDATGRTFGAQQLPMGVDEFRAAGSETIVPGITQNASFRTNVGFLSGAAGAACELRLIRADGSVAGVATSSLPPYSWTQAGIASLFPGAMIDDDSRLSIRTLSGSLSTYLSVIDQRSGDPVVTMPEVEACDEQIAVVSTESACPQAMHVASIASHAGARYQWSISNGSIQSGQGTEMVTFVPNGNGAVTLGVSVLRGCLTHAAKIVILAITPRVENVSAPSATAGAATTIRWSVSGTVASQSISGTDFPTTVTLTADARSYTYTPRSAGTKSITVTASSPCANAASAAATYDVSPSASVLGPGSGGSGGSYPGVQTFHAAAGRDYVVYVPAKYDPSRPAYLVFALGGQGEPWDMTLQLGWQELAERDGIVVVTMTPSSSGPGYSGAYDQPEFETILEAERDVPKRYNVAIDHISFWGFSAGAHLTYWLGLEAARSRRINGFAIQAGAIEAAASRLRPTSWPPQAGARRLPVYVSCGTEDSLIASLRRNHDMLAAAGYPVQTSEIYALGHTYRDLDVYAAWDFLKGLTPGN